ncbi:MAG: M61 family metallopeptidase [Asticcacaulis sp.]|nr:M61 family metallopeptidase [Asticcacaulis sp.]
MSRHFTSFVSVLALTAGLVSSHAMAQIAAPPAPVIQGPKDAPYIAPLDITVDMTDFDHRLFKVHEVIPVDKAGDFVFMLPKWIPGHHSPGTDLQRIADIYVHAGDKRLEWTRDPVDVYAWHVDVPQGAKAITVDFMYLAPSATGVSRIVMTQEMIDLQWNFASLYPAGYYTSRIPVNATIKFPAGWGYASGLDTATKGDGTVTFKTTDYDTLVDSPVYIGKYFKTYDLDPGGAAPVRLNVMGDKPEQVVATDEALAIHRKLIQQAYKLYGAHHYDHYDFLVSASDKLGGIGLEHHRSSEDGVQTGYFTDWKNAYVGRDLLAHEMTHSWNGKFRRGWDLWTPNFQVPMRDSLLWVYEGQTQYWGNVLATRSSLYSKDQMLQYLAITVASYDNLPARKWRALQDTTNDPIIASRAMQPWPSNQRSEDYYNEGMLIWLDADTLIREKTGGKKSLDDFAQAFFGIKNGDWGVTTYNFDEVVKTLNSVYPYDWATFLHTRLEGHGPDDTHGAPLDGVTRGGYKLVYSDTPTDFYKALETRRKANSFAYSIGIALTKDLTISSVLWDSPAFKAGMAPGGTLIAVNGRTADIDTLKAAITGAKTGTDPIELVVKVDDYVKTIRIDYHGGLRYPHLERIDGTPALLDDILAEKK